MTQQDDERHPSGISQIYSKLSFERSLESKNLSFKRKTWKPMLRKFQVETSKMIRYFVSFRVS